LTLVYSIEYYQYGLFADQRFFYPKRDSFLALPSLFPLKLWHCFALFFLVYGLFSVVSGLFWIVAELTWLVTALFRVVVALTMD
jgi:hypothetical protein